MPLSRVWNSLCIVRNRPVCRHTASDSTTSPPLACPLDAMGQVDRGPDDAVLGPALGADVAHHHLPGVQTDAHFQGRILRLRDIGLSLGRLHPQRTVDGLARRGREGPLQGIEKSQDRVS